MRLSVEAVLILAGAAGVGGATGLMLPIASGASPMTLSERACTVTDGDTIRCGEERIRLGIDAPELGRCRPGRVCAPGDGWKSKGTLGTFMTLPGAYRIERVGRDRYGRTLAVVYRGRLNLSCAQLRTGQAIYRADWDDGRRVRQDCPDAAR